MPVLRYSESAFQEAYGIRCKAAFGLPGPTALGNPFGGTICEVPPAGATAAHRHHETELFWITSGSGSIEIDGVVENVCAGDVLLLPPFSTHSLRNASGTVPIAFISTYWENPTRAFQGKAPLRALVMSAPPTPNGPLHLGHLSGPYLAADVLTRFLRQNQVDAHYLSGTDDHQSYVVTKARKLGQATARAVDDFSESIQKTLSAFDASPGVFLRPLHDAAEKRAVQDFYETLLSKGRISLRTAPTPHCGRCERVLFEAFVAGGCPHCETQTGGNNCEACGKPNDSGDLSAPRCTVCGEAAELMPVSRAYFDLEPFREALAAYHETTSMPAAMRKYVDSMFAEPLAPMPIAHPCEWGVGVNEGGLKALAWFEMAASYLYGAELVPGGSRDAFWKDEDAAVSQCFGFDNSYFYLLLLPALMLAADAGIRLPRHFLINQFYLLDGKKFSTSRGHAVWGDDILACVSSDALRLYLARTRAEERESNFSLEEFEGYLASVGVGVFDALMAHVSVRMSGRRIACDPRLEVGALTPAQRVFHLEAEGCIRKMALTLTPENFSLNSAAAAFETLARVILQFARSLEKESTTDTQLLLSGIQNLGRCSSALMPRFAADMHAVFHAEVPLRTDWPKGFEIVRVNGVECGNVDALSGRFARDAAGVAAFRQKQAASPRPTEVRA